MCSINDGSQNEWHQKTMDINFRTLFRWVFCFLFLIIVSNVRDFLWLSLFRDSFVQLLSILSRESGSSLPSSRDTENSLFQDITYYIKSVFVETYFKMVVHPKFKCIVLIFCCVNLKPIPLNNTFTEPKSKLIDLPQWSFIYYLLTLTRLMVLLPNESSKRNTSICDIQILSFGCKK